MLRLWKSSSLIFAFQAVVFAVLYFGFNAPFNVAVYAAALVAAPVMLVGALAVFVGASASSAVLAAASAAVSSIAFIVVPPSFATSVAVLVAASVAAYAAALAAQEEGAKESKWALFITALPLGIGTILGGYIWLAFKTK